MNPENRIRRAYEDLQQRVSRETDVAAGLDGVTRSGRRRWVPALAAAAVVVALIGGVALPGLLPGTGGDDDVVAPATSTTTTTLPSSTTGIGSASITTVPAGSSFDRSINDTIFVVAQRFDGVMTAGAVGRQGAVLPAGAVDAIQVPDGSLLAVSDNSILRLDSRSGEWKVDPATGSPMPPPVVVGSARINEQPSTVLLIGDKLIGWPPSDLIGLASGVPDETTLDATADGEHLVALSADTDGCRTVSVVALTGAADQDPTAVPIGTRHCLAQESGFARAVALSGDRVVVAESASLGAIEFTADEIAIYDAVSGVELNRFRLDIPADLDVSDIDIAGNRVLIAAEYLLVLDLDTGEVETLVDPMTENRAVLRVHWTVAHPGESASDPSTLAYRVTKVAEDDVLNVRFSPDPSAPIHAVLPPTYAAIGDTGETVTAPDGGSWRRITLLDPVRVVDLREPYHGGLITGWVNEAYLEPLTADRLPVTVSDIPPCAGDPNSLVITTPAGRAAPDHVFSIRGAVIGECVRFVVTFGANFDDSYPQYDRITTDVRPADHLPAIDASGEAIRIGVDAAWPEALSEVTEAGGLYVAREPDLSLSLVPTVPMTDPEQQRWVWGIPERGVLVIDISLPPAPEAHPPPAEHLVALDRWPVTENGAVTVTGVARPFEATLDIGLRDTDGNPVEATFSGSSFLGTVTATDYAVMTTDYIDAWGRFSFTIEGLDPGTYRLEFGAGNDDGTGGPDLVVPVTVPPVDRG